MINLLNQQFHFYLSVRDLPRNNKTMTWLNMRGDALMVKLVPILGKAIWLNASHLVFFLGACVNGTRIWQENASVRIYFLWFLAFSHRVGFKRPAPPNPKGRANAMNSPVKHAENVRGEGVPSWVSECWGSELSLFITTGLKANDCRLDIWLLLSRKRHIIC